MVDIAPCVVVVFVCTMSVDWRAVKKEEGDSRPISGLSTYGLVSFLQVRTSLVSSISRFQCLLSISYAKEQDSKEVDNWVLHEVAEP